MTKARFLRLHAHRLTSPEDKAAIRSIPRQNFGKAHVKAAKKSARHMRDTDTYRGGERIVMQSIAQAQWAGDYTRQIAPRDGAVYMASTGKTLMRKGVK